MYIRFFVHTDPSSPLSSFALEYLKSLIRIAPVRVIDQMRMGPAIAEGPWARYASLFHTPMDGEMINVVCTEPSRWTWVQRISAPKENKPDAELEDISGRLELYTVGARNVLIMPPSFQPLDVFQQETLGKYESLVVSTPEQYKGWTPSKQNTFLIPTPVAGIKHGALREAIVG